MDTTFITKTTPKLFSDMRSERSQYQKAIADDFSQYLRADLIQAFPLLIHFIHQFHHRADRRIEIEAISNISGHFLDRAVELTTEAFLYLSPLAGQARISFNHSIIADNSPVSLEESARAFDSSIAPIQISFRW